MKTALLVEHNKDFEIPTVPDPKIISAAPGKRARFAQRDGRIAVELPRREAW